MSRRVPDQADGPDHSPCPPDCEVSRVTFSSPKDSSVGQGDPGGIDGGEHMDENRQLGAFEADP